MKKSKHVPFEWATTRFLTIDPGTKYAGWALWRAMGHPTDRKYSQARVSFEGSGLWRANGKDAYQRAYDIAAQFDDLAGREAFSRVFIERPRNFGGSTGKGAAARNAGSVLKLMFLVGVLTGKALSAGMEVELVDVQRWKGNVKKEITARRVARAWDLDVRKMRTDETDAIGIGDYLVRKQWKVPIQC